MERRIKFIHCLTICVIIAYCIVQGYWLYNRYLLSLEEYEIQPFLPVWMKTLLRERRCLCQREYTAITSEE